MPQNIQVLYQELNPDSIINLDQPCHYEEFHRMAGYSELLTSSFGQEINDTYFAEMDRRVGHWTKLLDHISHWGIVYPIVVSTGVPKIRKPGLVPKEYRYTDSKFWINCETQGGARILAAKKLGIKIPALINDHVGLFPKVKPIKVRNLPDYGLDLEEIYISATYGVQIRHYPRIHLDITDLEYLSHKRAAIEYVCRQHLGGVGINIQKRMTHGSTKH